MHCICSQKGEETLMKSHRRAIWLFWKTFVPFKNRHVLSSSILLFSLMVERKKLWVFVKNVGGVIFFGSVCFFLLSANKVNLNTTHPFNSRAMWNNNLCLIFGNFFSITSISWIYKCHTTHENNYSIYIHRGNSNTTADFSPRDPI